MKNCCLFFGNTLQQYSSLNKMQSERASLLNAL